MRKRFFLTRFWRALPLLVPLVLYSNCSSKFESKQVSEEFFSVNFSGSETAQLRVISQPKTVSSESETSVAFEYSSSISVKLKCFLDSIEIPNCQSPLVLSALTDGEHVILFVAETEAVGADSKKDLKQINFLVDQSAPEIQIIAPANTTNADLLISFSALDPLSGIASVSCAFDAAGFVPCSPPSIKLTQLSEGPHRFQVKATDLAGNESATSEVQWTVRLGTPLTLPPEKAFYVATNGLDSNQGTILKPFKTIARGVRDLQPGETLLVGPGVYSESLIDVIPSGKSWQQPVTLKAQDLENRPVLRPPLGAIRVLDFYDRSFIHIEGFILDGLNSQYEVVKFSSAGGHDIRLKSSVVKGAPGNGILVSGAKNLELIDLDIQDNGVTDFNHGVYIAGSSVVVDGCRIFNNAGWGVQVYSEGSSALVNNIIRNSTIYNNARLGKRGVGIVLASGSGHKAYNNIIRGNNGGIMANYMVSNAAIYNNTIIGNRGDFAIMVGSTASKVVVKNNVVWKNATDRILDDGAGTLDFKNLVGTDPHFISFETMNYKLRPDSPAVDAADPLLMPFSDFLGNLRPLGAGPDIGAFESY